MNICCLNKTAAGCYSYTCNAKISMHFIRNHHFQNCTYKRLDYTVYDTIVVGAVVAAVVQSSKRL